MIGKMLGPFEIIALIGEGGMGEVWKARDTRLGRIMAIRRSRSSTASDSSRKRDPLRR